VNRWGEWNSPVAKKRSSTKRKTSTQMFLDFGQKDFERRVCDICGMLYAPGVAADESDHSTFCSVSKFHIGKRTCVKDANIVVSVDDGVIVVRLDSKEDRCKPLLSRVLLMKNKFIDEDMGFTASCIGVDDACWYYVALKARTVVGLAVVEKITDAHRIVRDDIEKNESSLILGVLQIWVDEKNRRAGIASKLLDAMRFETIYGCVVQLDQIAFSQPTVEGSSLARRYLGTNPPVYKLE